MSLHPCDCAWCERYGNSDDPPNNRPPIRNGSMYLESPGRCTCCHYSLGTVAYMVQRKVCVAVRPFGDRPIRFSATKRVPVCEVCVARWELDEARDTEPCRGCGRHLSFDRRLYQGERQQRRTCDNRCYRIALRKRRRLKLRWCIHCDKQFSPARQDAQFCSSACRQKAYRKRLVTEAVEPDLQLGHSR
jgi:hypothetical protein